MVGVDLTTKSEIIKASDKLRSSEKLKEAEPEIQCFVCFNVQIHRYVTVLLQAFNYFQNILNFFI
jgi:hypothetical protein